MGAKHHKYSEETAEIIGKLVLLGLKADIIAEVVGMARSTMFVHYKDTLKNYKYKKLCEVASILYQEAITPGKDNQAARFFILKTQAGWREKDRDEDRNNDKQPIIVNVGLKGETKDEGDTS